MMLNCSWKGRSRQMYSMMSESIRAPAAKERVVIDPAMLCSASVDMSPGSPRKWSPWRWLMKMWRSRENPTRCRIICSCAPSPQSIIINCSLALITWQEGRCCRLGLADPHPSMSSWNFGIEIWWGGGAKSLPHRCCRGCVGICALFSEFDA